MKKFLIYICSIAILLACVTAYLWALFLSDSKVIEKGELSYYLLIPKILRNVPVSKIGTNTIYEYTAPDGPKPTITILKFKSSKEKTSIQKELASYFTINKYKYKKGRFWKEKKEANIVISNDSDNEFSIIVELAEHLYTPNT